MSHNAESDALPDVLPLWPEDLKWSSECPCGRAHGHRSPSRMKPVCPTCDTIHATSDVVALGKFDPDGIRGYVPRVGGCGCVYRTRAEAEAAVCATRAATR